MKRITGRSSFFQTRPKNISKPCGDEIIRFYRMLIKMKKNRPNLNVNRIMFRLYPDFNLNEKK